MWYKFSLDTLQKALTVKIPSHYEQDTHLEAFAGDLLKHLDYRGPKVSIFWNPRLRTTAGLADSANKRVILNPVLKTISPAEIQRTLRHELAHMLAQYRAGRRRIQGHGPEWKQACKELKIPNEKRCHDLPIKKAKVKRNFFYECRSCKTSLARVRPLKKRAACLKCCRKHGDGKYKEEYRFIQLKPAA